MGQLICKRHLVERHIALLHQSLYLVKNLVVLMRRRLPETLHNLLLLYAFHQLIAEQSHIEACSLVLSRLHPTAVEPIRGLIGLHRHELLLL